MSTEVKCMACKEPFDVEALLKACIAWDAALDCVQFRCPHCADTAEARLETGRFSHGYVYAAGSAHFSAQIPVDVPELAVDKTSAGLNVTWGSARRLIPMR